MSTSLRFKCSNETVKGIYSLFSRMVEEVDGFKESIIQCEEVVIEKNFLDRTLVKLGSTEETRHCYTLEDTVLESINAKGMFEGNDSFSNLFMLRGLYFNDAYFYKIEDVCRSSEDFGVVGDRKYYSNMDIIYAPTCCYSFKDVCEVREDYKKYIKNGYKKIKLPSSFDSIKNNEDYRMFFNKLIKKGYTVNRLHEFRGDIFCRNRVWGYIGLNNLEGLEGKFYNELLELVVGLGKPVSSVHFYSDLNWSCILYRPSKVDGEFDIVIK